MKLSRKLTDFIRLEEGNIGRRSAVVTGALLASGVLGMMLTTEVAEASGCPPDRWHYETYPHTSHNNHFHNCLIP